MVHLANICSRDFCSLVGCRAIFRGVRTVSGLWYSMTRLKEMADMRLDLLKRDLVRLDWEVKDQEDFFDRISAELLRAGYIKDSFCEALA